MSTSTHEDIPFEIQTEIIKRVPDVKSLIQFRSVSKPWKSLIDSSKFITNHRPSHHNQRLLLRYFDSPESIIGKYVSVVDDDSFPQQMFPMTLPMSVTTTNLVDPYVSISTSQGLVCFCISGRNHNDHITRTAVLWNPAIRKSVDILVPNVLFKSSITFIGFGVSPHTNDPMLVKITYIHSVKPDCIPWHVEVFTLSTGVWRSLCTNLPRTFIRFSEHHVVIDRFIYWNCIDFCDVDGGGQMRNMIMSFDMEREEFTEISLPDCLTYLHSYMWNIFKLKESLVVLETGEYAKKQEHVIWIMEHGVPNLFKKLYTIKAPDASFGTVFIFRKSGEPIIRRSFNYGERLVTSVYDPCSKQFNDIAISEIECLYTVNSYQETLVLLDH